MEEERKRLKKIFINVCLRKEKKKHFFLILLSPESTEPFTRSNSKLFYFQVLLFVGKCLVFRYLSKIFEKKNHHVVILRHLKKIRYRVKCHVISSSSWKWPLGKNETLTLYLFIFLIKKKGLQVARF